MFYLCILNFVFDKLYKIIQNYVQSYVVNNNFIVIFHLVIYKY